MAQGRTSEIRFVTLYTCVDEMSELRAKITAFISCFMWLSKVPWVSTNSTATFFPPGTVRMKGFLYIHTPETRDQSVIAGGRGHPGATAYQLYVDRRRATN